ncbi:hypothetical protein [Mucilaginibacter sp.]|uniref:hypothetical protein n=1 Tax=Mucilaginibacter sp. TaxID=1882438 RepID=UPI0035BBF9CC
MAKNIKVVQCPHCGSIQKTEIKPDFFKCDSCGTEYYLDDDDINVNINYKHEQPVTDDSGQKRKITIAAIIIGCLILFWLFSMIFINNKSTTPATVEHQEIVVDTPAVKQKPPYDYRARVLYTNTQNGQPVLMRLARETITGADGQSTDFENLRCIFIDLIKKEQLSDVVLRKRENKGEGYNFNFHTFKDGTIYMIYNDAILYRLNQQANALVNVTNDLISRHHELSAGIASISYNDYSLTMITIDGDKLYYIPTMGRLFKDFDQMERMWYANDRAVYYEFRKDKLDDISQLLLKITPVGQVDQVQYEKILPNRKFFTPVILYQDKTNLLIAANINYSSPLVSMQSLNAKGQIKWTLPPKAYKFELATKCKQGYAINYRLGETEGVYIISADGKMLADYVISDK